MKRGGFGVDLLNLVHGLGRVINSLDRSLVDPKQRPDVTQSLGTFEVVVFSGLRHLLSDVPLFRKNRSLLDRLTLGIILHIRKQAFDSQEVSNGLQPFNVVDPGLGKDNDLGSFGGDLVIGHDGEGQRGNGDGRFTNV
jgi:hypothetical protein